jgi:outer membrane protein
LKKVVKAIGISLVVISSSFFANAAQAAQKIGYIGTAYIISKLPQREAILTELKGQLKDDQAELDKIRTSIQSKAQKIERDGALLGADGVQKLKIEISSLQAEGKIKGEAYQKKVQSLEYKARKKMIDLIQKSTKKVAEKEGYDLVIDSQSLQYVKTEFNLTEKVLADLK